MRDILRPAAAHLEGRTLVNVTNGTPDQAREMAAWAQSRGAAYVDGAVMVTPELVSGPEAFLLYSGNSAAYHRQEATLAVLGSSTYVGEDPALASVYDLSLLSAMFGMFGGYLHAAALVRSEGIPAAEVTPMIMSLLNAMIELFPETAREIDSGEHPTPSSNNAMMATALRNVLDGSREQRVSTALMEPIWALFDRASKEGLGDRDISALVPLIYSPDGARA
ncbi:MAG: NAD(P)-dependent oxidoreductase [Ectothiorhodospiraceae bacterium]|nr:NAD(P)-dependent oxidoreductase [Ectothiorhodospiraceae bacterium]